MSHYAVAVFADDGDFDRLLKPYGENNEEYFVFTEVPFNKIEEAFKAFQKRNNGWTLDEYIESENYIQKDGQWGYMSNPNGYWDWYSLGGKDYMFDLKDTADNQTCIFGYRKNDYKWYPEDKEAMEEAAEFWDDFIGETAIAQPPGMWNKKYYLDRYKTKEQYVKEWGRTIPYAFITPDGIWHSAGRVGWFGTSTETAEDADRYAAEWDAWIASDENPYVNLVDCHI